MSTRALVAVYENGKLKAQFTHRENGYLAYLGNMLISFVAIARDHLLDREGIPQNLTKPKINTILKKRSGLTTLRELFKIEDYFVENAYFTDWWCLDYIYRINFTFNPKALYSNWDCELEYTREIASVDEKWKEESRFIPLIACEGVHYKTETNLDRPIHPRLYGKVAQRELPTEPEEKSA